jgi:large subunit ribosomal protein L24
MSKPKVRIHKDDLVVVIAGKNKGRTGKVLQVLPSENRVVVEGVAIIKRHTRGQGEEPGRIVEREAAIHVSNVALWDSENNRPRKVSVRRTEEGGLVRVDRKSGQQI